MCQKKYNHSSSRKRNQFESQNQKKKRGSNKQKVKGEPFYIEDDSDQWIYKIELKLTLVHRKI